MSDFKELLRDEKFLIEVESYAQHLFRTGSSINIAQCWALAVEQELKRRGFVITKPTETAGNVIPLRRS